MQTVDIPDEMMTFIIFHIFPLCKFITRAVKYPEFVNYLNRWFIPFATEYKFLAMCFI